MEFDYNQMLLLLYYREQLQYRDGILPQQLTDHTNGFRIEFASMNFIKFNRTFGYYQRMEASLVNSMRIVIIMRIRASKINKWKTCWTETQKNWKTKLLLIWHCAKNGAEIYVHWIVSLMFYAFHFLPYTP